MTTLCMSLGIDTSIKINARQKNVSTSNSKERLLYNGDKTKDDWPGLSTYLHARYRNQVDDLCSVELARALDFDDDLRDCRQQFTLPHLRDLVELAGLEVKPQATPNCKGLLSKDLKMTNLNKANEQNCTTALHDQPAVYLCGHSLGLQPRSLPVALASATEHWARLGVLVHRSGAWPAALCDLDVARDFGRLLVGAKPYASVEQCAATDKTAVTEQNVSYPEVTVCNGLSVNLHLLMATFYRPKGQKRAVLLEAGAFPSDHYVVQSHIAWHRQSVESHKEAQEKENVELCEGETGKDEDMVIVKPRQGEVCLRTEDIIAAIRDNADRLALILLPGVQFYTGQLLDIKTLTRAGHCLAGCPVGWDLAHAVGNVPLRLHAWGVDFAVWCSYKFVNAGPGGLAGLFVHSNHHHTPAAKGPSAPETTSKLSFGIPAGPQLTGWWGHRDKTRFQMTNKMELADGALGYRVSNPPLLLATCLKASIDVFKSIDKSTPIHSNAVVVGNYNNGQIPSNNSNPKCNNNCNIDDDDDDDDDNEEKYIKKKMLVDWSCMARIRRKSLLLTGYLIFLLTESSFVPMLSGVRILTPLDPVARGAQLSIGVDPNLLLPVTVELKQRGFICDFRKPDCLRVTPAPLYNTFEEVFLFVVNLVDILTNLKINKVKN